MELNRNQFFMIGLVVLFLGIELRLVDSFVLNDKTTRFLAAQTKSAESTAGSLAQFLPASGPIPRKVIRPPQWLGWSLISLGSVLVLHSLAMRKPEG
jgi:hypothetical protein